MRSYVFCNDFCMGKMNITNLSLFLHLCSNKMFLSSNLHYIEYSWRFGTNHIMTFILLCPKWRSLISHHCCTNKFYNPLHNPHNWRHTAHSNHLCSIIDNQKCIETTSKWRIGCAAQRGIHSAFRDIRQDILSGLHSRWGSCDHSLYSDIFQTIYYQNNNFFDNISWNIHHFSSQ